MAGLSRFSAPPSSRTAYCMNCSTTGRDAKASREPVGLDDTWTPSLRPTEPTALRRCFCSLISPTIASRTAASSRCIVRTIIGRSRRSSDAQVRQPSPTASPMASASRGAIVVAPEPGALEGDLGRPS